MTLGQYRSRCLQSVVWSGSECHLSRTSLSHCLIVQRTTVRYGNLPLASRCIATETYTCYIATRLYKQKFTLCCQYHTTVVVIGSKGTSGLGTSPKAFSACRGRSKQAVTWSSQSLGQPGPEREEGVLSVAGVTALAQSCSSSPSPRASGTGAGAGAGCPSPAFQQAPRGGTWGEIAHPCQNVLCHSDLDFTACQASRAELTEWSSTTRVQQRQRQSWRKP